MESLGLIFPLLLLFFFSSNILITTEQKPLTANGSIHLFNQFERVVTGQRRQKPLLPPPPPVSSVPLGHRTAERAEMGKREHLAGECYQLSSEGQRETEAKKLCALT